MWFSALKAPFIFSRVFINVDWRPLTTYILSIVWLLCSNELVQERGQRPLSYANYNQKTKRWIDLLFCLGQCSSIKLDCWVNIRWHDKWQQLSKSTRGGKKRWISLLFMKLQKGLMELEFVYMYRCGIVLHRQQN